MTFDSLVQRGSHHQRPESQARLDAGTKALEGVSRRKPVSLLLNYLSTCFFQGRASHLGELAASRRRLSRMLCKWWCARWLLETDPATFRPKRLETTFSDWKPATSSEVTEEARTAR